MSTVTTVDESTSLASLLAGGAGRERIAAFLDSLEPADRIAQALALRGRQIGRLYEACAGGPGLAIEDFVPAALGAGETVIFDGRNSLPLFTRFQKRFARVGDRVIGYNHQTMAPVTGPGYFAVAAPSADSDVPGELYFDYTAFDAAPPPTPPSGWPAYRPNRAGLSRLVYADMKDTMRRVATGVVVGSAYKVGKPAGAYFVLASARSA